MTRLAMQEKSEGIVFKIFAQPRSAKNAVAGIHGDALKIKLTAPPVDGAANEMCIKYLSKCLGVSKSSLEIMTGQTGRTKQILVRCPDEDPVRREIKTRIRKIAGDLSDSPTE